MNIINRFTLRTLLKNKVRTFVTILGIILATAMFVSITSIITSLQNYMLDIVVEQSARPWRHPRPLCMKILHELSWLWETLGIALVAAAVCVACAALIGKAAKKKLSKKLLAVIGAAAFVGAILAVILIARTPMPL